MHDLVIREFDSDEVKQISDALVLSQDFQDRLCSSVREAIIEIATGRLNLGAMSSIDISDFRSLLEKLANEAVTVGHTDLTQDGGLTPVLGMSIVERLRVRFQGNRNALQLKIQDLLRGAVTSVKQTTANKGQPETKGDPTDPKDWPFKQFAVFLPPPNGANDGFYAELGAYFKNGIPANANAKVELLPIGRPQEITMMAVDYWMAARLLEPIATLRDKYEATIERHGAEAVLRMHIEEAAAELPELFPPDSLLEAQAWYFIGTMVGFVKQEPTAKKAVGFVRQDPESGRIFAVFEGEDGSRFDEPVELATSEQGFYRGNIRSRLGKLRDAARKNFKRATPELQQAWQATLVAAVKTEDDRIQKETDRNSAARANQEWDAKKKVINRICQEIIK